MKKLIALFVLAVALLVVVKARPNGKSEKLPHRVKMTQVNEWQAIVYCRNGRTPAINKEAIAGTVIVSCEGREQENE